MAKGFSPGYIQYMNSPQWKQGWRRKWTLRLLFGRDVICPWFEAQDVEHLTYKNFKHELPIRDLLPLNRVIHRHIITPIKALLRKLLGRELGNFVVAWFLRCFLFFWYYMIWFWINELLRYL